ncbi:VWA domain-containing protein [Streptomyces sp. NPDC002740]
MISLAKIEQQAPGLVSLAKTAAVSLEKTGLVGHRAAVQLVLDHSGSMSGFYADGSVQRLADQALGLSVNLDDDGTVPLIFFGSYVEQYDDIRLDNYAGIIETTHPKVHWGSTDYVAGMKAAIAEHQNSGATDPGLIIFQTDGEPDERWAVERLLKRASKLPIFWAFIGFGGRVSFLEKLNDLRGRKVDNASFFHAADPHAVTDEQLYDGIARQYAQWITAARAAGILA